LYDVAGLQHFRGPCSLHLHREAAGNRAFQNVSVLPHHYMAS